VRGDIAASTRARGHRRRNVAASTRRRGGWDVAASTGGCGGRYVTAPTSDRGERGVDRHARARIAARAVAVGGALLGAGQRGGGWVAHVGVVLDV
jgi:hypothetical protein